MFGRLIRPFAAAAALTIFATAPTGAESQTKSSQHSLGILGHVPVSCRVSVEGSLTSGSSALLREFCNSPTGYQVVADYPSDLPGAKLIVDGTTVKLAEGPTVVSRSANARIAARQISLELPDGVGVGSISFRIVPL